MELNCLLNCRSIGALNMQSDAVENKNALANSAAPFVFDPAERRAIDWFRQQFWAGSTPAETPDHAIAFMLLRFALGRREEVAGWLDEVIRYRKLEGVSI